MEGQSIVTDPKKILIDATKKKLNQNSQCELFHEHLTEALREIWTDFDDWHTVDWPQHGIRFIGRMPASVFAGPRLARDAEWQELILTSTLNTFMGVRSLRAWPAFLRPIVHWFLPELRTYRQQLRLARQKFNDTIEWLEEIAAGRPYDAAAAQVAFAISAMHITSELLKQALLDICMHPELIPAIRDEANKAIEESGWTTAGVFKMQLLDSAIKETQRLKPGTKTLPPTANLERKAMRDIVLPNGMTISGETNVAVDSSMMWDPTIYPNPSAYDGYRFLRLRQSGNAGAALASTSPEHIAFGIGKPICPGRFFASNGVKIALAKILLTYDVRIPDGVKPKVVEMGFEMLSNPEAKLEIRKRPDCEA
ncbi:hypothetical protein SI65_06098 [Aspergillus cristatus]|uniref:Cytochrome P450 n=1 Tax=Aspergillus cristatus TaxID=573508 RepID=A0A1E3BB91_ASPCR|nr:hypothetical protein SI65_06098 [Aspergillus cristatus]